MNSQDCGLCCYSEQEKWDGGWITIKDCGHEFHFDCIYNHCKKRAMCPRCNVRVNLPDLEKIKRGEPEKIQKRPSNPKDLIKEKNEKIRILELKLCEQNTKIK